MEINPARIQETTAAKYLTSDNNLQQIIDMGRLSASLIHEISSPLTAALLNLEQVNDQKSVSVKATKSSLIHLKRYVDAARMQLVNRNENKAFSLDPQMKEVKRLLAPLAKTANIRLSVAKLPRVKLIGDPTKFLQILTNLIVNAIEAYGPDSVLRVREVKVSLWLSPHDVTIIIADWGGVISAEQQTKLFEPFYTTKNIQGNGLGIGLATVKQYVCNSFNGNIIVRSDLNRGTRFIIRLPYKK